MKAKSGSRYKLYGKTHYERNKKTYYLNKVNRLIKLRNFIISYKKNSKCKDCKNSNWKVLEFDHLPSFKKVLEISHAVGRGWSIDRLKTELNKCEVVCANCHRLRTYKRNNKLPSHSGDCTSFVN